MVFKYFQQEADGRARVFANILGYERVGGPLSWQMWHGMCAIRNVYNTILVRGMQIPRGGVGAEYLNGRRRRGRWRSLPLGFVGFDVAPYGPADAIKEGRVYETSVLYPTGERGGDHCTRCASTGEDVRTRARRVAGGCRADAILSQWFRLMAGDLRCSREG